MNDSLPKSKVNNQAAIIEGLIPEVYAKDLLYDYISIFGVEALK
jgi:hypothetical protein